MVIFLVHIIAVTILSSTLQLTNVCNNVGQNHGVNIANRYFEYVAQFRCMTPVNPNLIHDEIKRRLNSGNACYHSVQNLLSSSLLSKEGKN
jgi:hypothetical protein